MLTPIAEAAYAERDIFALGQDSLRRYPASSPTCSAATGPADGFRQSGTLQVAYDSDDLAVLAETRLLQESFGVHLEQLTARECREAEPMLDPAVRGGLLGCRRRLGRPAAARDGSGGGRGRRCTARPPAGHRGAVQRWARCRRPARRRLGPERALDRAGRWLAVGQIPGLPTRIAPPVRPVKGQIIRLRTTASMDGGGPAARPPPADSSRRRPRLQRLPGPEGQRRAGRRCHAGGTRTGHDGHGGRILGAAARRADPGTGHHRARDRRCRRRPAAGHARQRADHRPERAAGPRARDRAFPGRRAAGAGHGRHGGRLPAHRYARPALAAVCRGAIPGSDPAGRAPDQPAQAELRAEAGAWR